MYNSKKIGNITEVEAMLAFMKLGYTVLSPYGDCDKYDFVFEIEKKFFRVQCKTSSSKDNGSSFYFSCRSSHKKGGECINEKNFIG